MSDRTAEEAADVAYPGTTLHDRQQHTAFREGWYTHQHEARAASQERPQPDTFPNTVIFDPPESQERPSIDVERLRRISELQPEAVATLRRHGFVMDKLGPLDEDADELTRWKVLAFSLYTDLVEASTIADHILEAASDGLSGPVGE